MHFLGQNSISLCPASFCIPRPKFPVTPGVSWLPTFAFQSPINLYSIDQIHNPDKILTFLLTDLTSAHKWPAIGGPTTSDVCLQQAPFCFSRQNSINNSYPQLGTIGEGNGNPLQYSCLENPMDGGAWRLQPMGSRCRTRLSDFTFTFHFHALEKEMATHSSVLAWRISGIGEPGGLPSTGSHRVGHDWSDLAAAAAAFLELRMFGT